MIKESIISIEPEISFFNELNTTTNSSTDFNIFSKHSIIPLDNNNHLLTKDSESKIKLLGRKIKFEVTYENKNKFITKKINNKSNLPNITGLNFGQWNKSEKIKFIEGIYIYGSNWKLIKKNIGTRLASQVRSHAQKFFLKCKKFKDDSLDIDFTKANIDTKYIIKTLRDIISNSKDENIIEILYKKLNKLQLKKDVFKKDLSKFDDKLKEKYINNDINSNKEKNLDNLQKNDNYTYSKKDSGNIFELRDYCGDFKIINLFDFDEPIKKKEFNEIFNEEINNNFSFFSKDNDFIIDEFINMDNNEKKFW